MAHLLAAAVVPPQPAPPSFVPGAFEPGPQVRQVLVPEALVPVALVLPDIAEGFAVVLPQEPGGPQGHEPLVPECEPGLPRHFLCQAREH